MPTVHSPDIKKIHGIHYTPQALSDFIAAKILAHYLPSRLNKEIKIFDPAAGDGALLFALTKMLDREGFNNIKVLGLDTDSDALEMAREKIEECFKVSIDLKNEDFLRFINKNYGVEDNLFTSDVEKFDLVISNPPYVRVQNLGQSKAQEIANDFGLKGRIDLYYPFICGISRILKPGGMAGIIVSNRFMTTKSGASVRKRILEDFDILHLFDLGDTKFFEAAVLPAILIVRKKEGKYKEESRFTKIYSMQGASSDEVETVFEALDMQGCIKVRGGQTYLVKQGSLHEDSECWRINEVQTEGFISEIKKNTFCNFGEIGKIRVGVKTTADDVFIRSNWNELEQIPELLFPLITHHIANRFRSIEAPKFLILYPHEIRDNVRSVVDIKKYPNTYKYLMKHKERLQSRKYVIDAGRNWYEIWVPHDPRLWKKKKIVFRDIVEKPTFWMDLNENIVNGDCYWFTNDLNKNEELLWLAMSVANSTFIEFYYDQMFHNKLYSNKRRFMSQYVEKFPIPNPNTAVAKQMIKLSRDIFDGLKKHNPIELQNRLDGLVWRSFGLSYEEVLGKGNLELLV